MKSQRVMSKIIRGLALLCWGLALLHFFGLLQVVWERRASLGTLGGYLGGLLPLAILIVLGFLFWKCDRQIARWLSGGSFLVKNKNGALTNAETKTSVPENEP